MGQCLIGVSLLEIELAFNYTNYNYKLLITSISIARNKLSSAVLTAVQTNMCLVF